MLALCKASLLLPFALSFWYGNIATLEMEYGASRIYSVGRGTDRRLCNWISVTKDDRISVFLLSIWMGDTLLRRQNLSHLIGRSETNYSKWCFGCIRQSHQVLLVWHFDIVCVCVYVCEPVDRYSQNFECCALWGHPSAVLFNLPEHVRCVVIGLGKICSFWKHNIFIDCEISIWWLHRIFL